MVGFPFNEKAIYLLIPTYTDLPKIKNLHKQNGSYYQNVVNQTKTNKQNSFSGFFLLMGVYIE